MTPLAEDIIRSVRAQRPVVDQSMAFIALGVTGGIGAYKAVEIARGLQTATGTRSWP